MIKKLAVIFDLDGTLVDTESVHAEAESVLLRDLGVNMAPGEITRKCAGISTESYIEKLA